MFAFFHLKNLGEPACVKQTNYSSICFGIDAVEPPSTARRFSSRTKTPSVIVFG